MWLNARKVEAGTSSVFARKHTVGKVDTLPFRAAIGDPQAGLGRSSYPPDLESRSTTSFLGRACLTEAGWAPRRGVLRMGCIPSK